MPCWTAFPAGSRGRSPAAVSCWARARSLLLALMALCVASLVLSGSSSDPATGPAVEAALRYPLLGSTGLRAQVLAKFIGDDGSSSSSSGGGSSSNLASLTTVETWHAMRAAVEGDAQLAALLYLVTRKLYTLTAGPHAGGTAISYPPGATPDGGFEGVCPAFLLNLLLPVRPDVYAPGGDQGAALYCSGSTNLSCGTTSTSATLNFGMRSRGGDGGGDDYVVQSVPPPCVGSPANYVVVNSTAEYAFWAQNQRGADDSLIMWYMIERLLLLGLLGETRLFSTLLVPGAPSATVPLGNVSAMELQLAQNRNWTRGQPLMVRLDPAGAREIGSPYMWLSVDEVLNIVKRVDTQTPMARAWNDSLAVQFTAAGFQSSSAHDGPAVALDGLGVTLGQR